MKKILITPRPFLSKGQKYLDELQAAGYIVECNTSGGRFSKEELKVKIKDADAIITGNDPLDQDVIDCAKKLKVISKYGVGLDNINVEYANSRNIVVHKALNANSVSVAEMAILMMLSSARKYVEIEQQAKCSNDVRLVGTELHKKTLGLIGLGAIGKHVAHIANAMGMEIIAYDPYINQSQVFPYINFKELDEVYQLSDVISLHLPLLDSTRHMIDQHAFEKMKPSAILINTARGGLIDEDSLYNALITHKISFASEDIELKERKEATKQLINYSITPHAASFTQEADLNTIQISIKNVTNELEKR
ncbi:phosphoglycerate dehydrogenase [Citrobacter sp. Cb009]|uniref:phosphoglycerate dehydrogenase n=1 Tax=Citrobacter sp. Cb009 TaxID=2985010 RepID=UPI0025755D25|nr:phosphoglycerate dehydrogenase [Citrobacter sp. Cb009]MDM3444142.1 phosphoglycerate dehydrogenase [Citrobacter sp. Cb009]